MNSIRNGRYRAGATALGILVASLAALPAEAQTSLVIRDFVLAHDIDQREPVGEADSFRVGDGKAVAFARIWNGGEPTRLSFQWRFGEKIFATVPVTVGVSPSWRTWSTVKLRPGVWHVGLLDADGTMLAERAFRVEAKANTPIATSTVPARAGVSEPVGRAAEAPLPEIPTSADYPSR